jgi:hypothetical protein
MVHWYKYYVTGHYPSSCFYPKHRPVYISKRNVSEIGTGPIDWAQMSRFLPEDGDRIQSPISCVLKCKQDGVLDKNGMMDNVQKHNICTYLQN